MKLRFTVMSLVILAAAAAFAAESPLRQLDYFNGSWTCKGTAFAMEGAPEHAVHGTLTKKWIMNGAWPGWSTATRHQDQSQVKVCHSERERGTRVGGRRESHVARLPPPGFLAHARNDMKKARGTQWPCTQRHAGS
jgi:hypothetical protein